MKLTLVSASNPQDSATGNDLTVTCRDKVGREHTLVFTDRAQQDLFAAIAGSAPAPSNTKPRRSLVPVGIQLARTSHHRLGLKLFLTPVLALHLALEQPLAEVLQRELAAFEWPDVTKQ
jgi:hypothetical protein